MTQAPLAEQLRHDLAVAMKAHDNVTVRTLRMVMAAIKSAEVAGKQAVELDDAAIVKVLQKQASQRSDSARAFADAGRTERAEAELAERAVIERYLPEALGDDELQVIVAEEVAAYTGEPKAAMGMVIKAVNARVAGRADGKRVAELVKAKVSSPSNPA
ncbi:MAG: GatB/YqeY domain-containing protein [Acidimicrobiia bacterium]